MRATRSLPLVLFALAATAVTSANARAADQGLSREYAEAFPEHHSHLAVTFNPLATLIGRFGGNVVWVPGEHHGVTLSAAYAEWSPGDCGHPGAFSLAGNSGCGGIHGILGSIGYRYYSSDRGPAGIFFGPSLLLGDLSPNDGAGSFATVGAAMDGGVAGSILAKDGRSGLTVGVGLGVQLGAFPGPFPSSSGNMVADSFGAPTILPRVLLEVGMVF